MILPRMREAQSRELNPEILARVEKQYDIQVGGFYQGAHPDEPSGDLLKIIPLDDHLSVFMGDVESHGPVSAVDSLKILSTMDAETFQAKLQEQVKGTDILLDLESKDLLGFRSLMTLALLRFFPSGVVEFASAGADALFIIRREGTVEVLSKSNALFLKGLAVSANLNLEYGETILNLGDYALLFTDGVGESILQGTNIQFSHMLKSAKHAEIRKIFIEEFLAISDVSEIPRFIISALSMKSVMEEDKRSSLPDGHFRDDASLFVLKRSARGKISASH